jgi:hypothetical protein
MPNKQSYIELYRNSTPKIIYRYHHKFGENFHRFIVAFQLIAQQRLQIAHALCLYIRVEMVVGGAI